VAYSMSGNNMGHAFLTLGVRGNYEFALRDWLTDKSYRTSFVHHC